MKCMKEPSEAFSRMAEEIESLKRAKTLSEEAAKVLAEQVGEGNLGKIQKALDFACAEARRRLDGMSGTEG